VIDVKFTIIYLLYSQLDYFGRILSSSQEDRPERLNPLKAGQ